MAKESDHLAGTVGRDKAGGMLFRLLADENFNNHILRALTAAVSTIDVVRVQDVDLLGVDDPAVLAWAADAIRACACGSRSRGSSRDLQYDTAPRSSYVAMSSPGPFSKELPESGGVNESGTGGK